MAQEEIQHKSYSSSNGVDLEMNGLKPHSGGTLAKLVYVDRCKCLVRNRQHPVCNGDALDSVADNDDSDDVIVKLKLVTFDADDVDSLLHFLGNIVAFLRRVEDHVQPIASTSCGRSSSMATRDVRVTPMIRVRATGVGCFFHRESIASSLGDRVNLHVDGREMEHCVNGISLLWRHLPPDDLLHLDASDVEKLTFQTELPFSGALPCLVVNMGSALTIVQVNSDGRVVGIVGGSSQGGMTFLGLGNLLTKAKSFDELMALASRGRCGEVDLTVKDVAGTDYNSTAADLVVSSFGKVAKRRATDPEAAFNEDDLAASLLFCITDEMVKTVYLVAKAQNIGRALFCGSFFASKTSMMDHIRQKIHVCVSYLGHPLSVVFLRHHGYLGAIGLLSDIPA